MFQSCYATAVGQTFQSGLNQLFAALGSAAKHQPMRDVTGQRAIGFDQTVDVFMRIGVGEAEDEWLVKAEHFAAQACECFWWQWHVKICRGGQQGRRHFFRCDTGMAHDFAFGKFRQREDVVAPLGGLHHQRVGCEPGWP